jgi:hypothetical protein
MHFKSDLFVFTLQIVNGVDKSPGEVRHMIKRLPSNKVKDILKKDPSVSLQRVLGRQEKLP